MDRICPCGRRLHESTGINPYRAVRRDKNGRIIFALCVHGHVVIDDQKDLENE